MDLPDLGGWIEGLLRQTDANVITNVFLAGLLVIALVSVVQARRGGWSGFVNYTPNLLTSLGILGTFVGIVVGLLGFDVTNIDGSIGPLLEGLKTAFVTSLGGMALAILFKSADSIGWLRRSDNRQTPEEVGPADILATMRDNQKSLDQLTRSIAGGEESTLLTQMRLLRSDIQDQSKNALEQLKAQSELQASLSRSATLQQQRFEQFTGDLWKKLDEFAEMLSKSATEQVIVALREVISDFNRNLTEQFGENFKALDASVKRLVDWQENYREQMAQMTLQYQLGVEAIQSTEQAVAHISQESRQIPVTMGLLKELLETTQHQLDELERHLKAFSDMRDKAVEAVPQVRENVEILVTDVSDAVKDAGNNIAEATSVANATIVEGATEFRNNVKRTNEGLATASDELAKNSVATREQLGKTLKDVNAHVRETVATFADQAREVGKTLTDANCDLQTHTREVQSQVVDSIGKMQSKLESSLEEVFAAQTRHMSRATDAINSELKEAVARTGEGVTEQVKALDKAMEHEIEEVMKEMARLLGGISRQFTDDYQELVAEMNKVVTYKTAAGA